MLHNENDNKVVNHFENLLGFFQILALIYAPFLKSENLPHSILVRNTEEWVKAELRNSSAQM